MPKIKYHSEEERKAADRERKRVWVASKRQDQAFKADELARARDYDARRRSNRTPEQHAQQLAWGREWYARLTSTQIATRNQRRQTYRHAGREFSLCPRCHLWRTDLHNCLVDRVRARFPNGLRGKPEKPPEILPRWPYGFTGEWPMSVVVKYIPDGLADNLRADIGQELCVQLLAGEISEEEIGAALSKARSKAYGPWVKSLDAPVFGDEDGKTLGDMLVYEEGLG